MVNAHAMEAGVRLEYIINKYKNKRSQIYKVTKKQRYRNSGRQGFYGDKRQTRQSGGGYEEQDRV